MDCVITKSLDADMLTNDTEYFITMLNDRFERVVDRWVDALNKRFGSHFEPIYVLSSQQNRFFKKRNFIAINKALSSIGKAESRKFVYLEDYEDLNALATQSPTIRKLIEQLLTKQNRVFVIPFTSSFLRFGIPGVVILGPNPDIATMLDDKATQVTLFESLDLPRNNTRIFETIANMKQEAVLPAFVSPAFGSGGAESKVVYRTEDFETFEYGLRVANKNGPFVCSRLITNIDISPNASAIVVGSNDTRVICVTDQILRDNMYLGNIFPSRASAPIVQKIEEITKKVGDHLSGIGFRGLFGIDFIVDTAGVIYTVDLNPRRQGGYLCNVMASKVDIVSMELSLALGEKVSPPTDFGIDKHLIWAHSKVKPYFHNTRILNEFKSGYEETPFKKPGATFECIYYPKSSVILSGNAGYYITSGSRYNEVLTRLIRETEKLVSTNFELYGGAPPAV